MRRAGTMRILTATVAALSLLVVLGCKAKPASELVMDSPEAAWESFRANYCVSPDQPSLLVKASFQYSRTKPIKRTNRTLVSLWGDFDGPMRLDIKAGMGKLLAHIREDQSGLLVFYPMEKRAYAHSNPVLGATRLGMPFPFSLGELARVSVGDFSGLVPKTFEKAERTVKGYVYTLNDGLASTATLDTTGRPLLLKGQTQGEQGTKSNWGLEINSYGDEDAANPFPMPGRVTLTTDHGEKGVLRIKARELKVQAWSEESTGLELPDNIVYHRLDSGLIRRN